MRLKPSCWSKSHKHKPFIISKVLKLWIGGIFVNIESYCSDIFRAFHTIIDRVTVLAMNLLACCIYSVRFSFELVMKNSLYMHYALLDCRVHPNGMFCAAGLLMTVDGAMFLHCKRRAFCQIVGNAILIRTTHVCRRNVCRIICVWPPPPNWCWPTARSIHNFRFECIWLTYLVRLFDHLPLTNTISRATSHGKHVIWHDVISEFGVYWYSSGERAVILVWRFGSVKTIPHAHIPGQSQTRLARALIVSVTPHRF